VKDKLITFGVVCLAILVTGAVLDELGNQGRLGSIGRNIAQKITRGFGV